MAVDRQIAEIKQSKLVVKVNVLNEKLSFFLRFAKDYI